MDEANDLFDNLSTATTETSDNEYDGKDNGSRQRKNHSFVWNHFNKISMLDESNNILSSWVQCNYCSTKYLRSSSSRSGTGNMSVHLKKYHASKIEGRGLSEISQDSFVFSQQRFREALLKWIIISNQPFTELEQVTFKDVVRSLNPDAQIISADTIKRDLVTSFTRELETLKQKLHDVSGKFSFTQDAWTSKNMISFLGIRVYWLNAEWRQETALLDFSHIDEEHTGKNLCKIFLHAMKKCGLPLGKFHAITMDNASNNNTFMNFLVDESVNFACKITNTGSRVRCFAHILNLAVQDLLKNLEIDPEDDELVKWADYDCEEIEEQELDVDDDDDDDSFGDAEDDGDELTPVDDDLGTSIKSIITKVRSLVKKIRKSEPMMKRFQKFCKFHKIKFLRPVIDVKSRWNSTYQMLQRALDLRIPLRTFCSNVRNMDKFLIMESDWKELDTLMGLLQSFDRATKLFSMEGHPTITAYLPMFDFLLSSLDQFIENNEGGLVIAAKFAKEKLKKYKPTIDDNLIPFLGVFLNPSLKLTYFKEHEDSYDKRTFKIIKNAVTSTYNDGYAAAALEADEEPKDAFLAFLHKRSKAAKKIPEIQKYISSDLASPGTNILDWWKSQSAQYPGLSRMAQDYLAVQGSSVSNERDFAGGVDLVAPTRCSMNSDTVAACMCLKSWWK